MKKYLYLMAALAIAAVSCKKSEPVTPSITLSTPTEVTVPTDGGIQTISFTTNVPWKASIDNSNWTVSPTSGDAGTASVKVTAINNTGNDPVVAKVTIKAETASETITFTQLQKDAMIVDVTSYDAPAEGGTVSVKVNANVEVTATTDAEWITIPTPTKGLVEKTFDLTVAANDGEAREGIVVLSGAGQKVEVTVNQAAFEPYFEVDFDSFEVTKEGGEFTVNINTNVDFKVTDYHDGSFPWQTATLSEDKKTLKVVIDANTGYDVRESYVKFTVPAIQDPVVDDAGEPTGEYTDHVVRVYFEQEGLTEIAWSVVLPEEFKNAAQLTVVNILSENTVAVGAGDNVAIYDIETGELLEITDTGASEVGIEVAEVFSDDAGNVLVATATAYNQAFDIYVSSPSMGEPTVLIHSYFDYYGYGLGHFHARGDVMKDGIVTALIADGPAAGVPVTGAYWEIKDGKATTWAPYGEEKTEETCQPEYVSFTTAGEIWLANRADFAALGTNAAAGFLYNGYDGTYALQHYAGGVTTPLTTIGDRANGVSCIQAGVWGETPIVAINNMAWFPQWAMPSVLTIFNAATMEPITTVNILQEGLEGTYLAEPSTAVLFGQEDGALVVYSADGAQGLLQKIVVPTK